MVGRWTSFGKCSGKIIYKIVEKLLTNAGIGCIIKVEIKERAMPEGVKMYKITYNRKGQKSKCTYETTEKELFEKYLQELKNDETVSNINY